jgi:putative transcriptional regulator
MSQQINLSSAYDYLEKLTSEMSASKLYYYDILYTLSTTVLENRLKREMTQKDFAKLLGVSQAMISKYESGDYNFTVKQICKICEKLDLNPNLSLSNLNVSEKNEYRNSTGKNIENISSNSIDYYDDFMGSAA